MRIVLQRAKEAAVTVSGEVVGKIGPGLVCLVGFTEGDGEEQIRWMVDKLIHLRIFSDEEGKMNRSLMDTGGAILSVSQFTLYGDCRKGRRPNFMAAEKPLVATRLYDRFNEVVRDRGIPVETGIFGEMMDVSLVNDGPVTLILDSPNNSVDDSP
ncbi:D-aminoacyl-tRNA deacylase [Marininema halotolerans]|uniref:D-aminoacyl-tRNA deacylase n=1 Tax=Marininema halotolerans TaxID=1155944 RepID=A0A1I6RR58_9BACL|nr:D-aminoacyl-tRNA deacylase [Marininema halotolerans]SFS67207.1 D-tyrosyl-tRNA(Tyr) deacylase [Marininema halotolerans]